MTLTCSLTGLDLGNPVAKYNWTRGHGDWSEYNTNDVVTVSVTSVSEAGTYTCLPWNGHGAGDGGTVQLSVESKYNTL